MLQCKTLWLLQLSHKCWCVHSGLGSSERKMNVKKFPLSVNSAGTAGLRGPSLALPVSFLHGWSPSPLRSTIPQGKDKESSVPFYSVRGWDIRYVNTEVNLVAFLQTVATFAPAICIWASSGLFIPSWGRRNLMLKGFAQKKTCTPLLLHVLVVFHLSSHIALFFPAPSCFLHPSFFCSIGL